MLDKPQTTYEVTTDLLKIIRHALEHEEVVYRRGNSQQYKKAIKSLEILESRYATN